MDTQGVSMCEAMSSGLVCISSDNSAIPEFLPDDAGFRTRTVRDIVKAVEYLMNNPQQYGIISENAASFIRKKCELNDMIMQELQLIEGQSPSGQYGEVHV
jgi:glycosyltransferase involved in cell wall biosynthesis